MSNRIHTTEADAIHVQQGTDTQIDAELGYEDPDTDDESVHLVLNDMGNMEAMVLRGDPDAFRNLAQQILNLFPLDPQ